MPQNPTTVVLYTQVDGGPSVPVIADAAGALPFAQRHGTLFGAAFAGALYQGGNQTGATLSAALATTYVGLCLSNPAASGVNLALQRVSGVLNVAPAALTSLGLITGYAAGGITVHATALAPRNALINGAAPVGLLDAACTLVGSGAGSPAWAQWFGVTPGATSVAQFTANVDGSIIIPPGGYVAIGSLIAGPTAGLLGSMVWEELAI